MNRRQFLASATAGSLALGCSRQAPAPGAARVTMAESRRIAQQLEARQAHLKMLEGFRVPVKEKRTTPPRPVEVAKLFPDLDLRTRLKMTLRCHPRFSEEPAASETKIGGQFYWPASEPWPVCETFGIPLVPVLQVHLEDVPATVKFKPGSDLLQVLWSPRDHDKFGPKPQLFWRNSRNIKKDSLAELPSTEFAQMDYVPVPCRPFLESVLEYPDWSTIRVTPLGERLLKWKPEAGGDPVAIYQKQLSAAPGTKIGGFPRWLDEPKLSPCKTCNRGMDYLLTIDSDEWGEPSWIPSEEQGKANATGFSHAPGLTLPAPGNRHAFVCRRCADWPINWVS